MHGIFLWEKVRQFNLCPKLSGLQLAKGLCFEYQTGGCSGACMGVETVKKYNRKVVSAIESFHERGSSVAIIGKGRHQDEQSLVLIDEGNYFGFGFFGRDVSIADMESARTYVRKSTETPTVQNLINSYITNPRGSEVITF